MCYELLSIDVRNNRFANFLLEDLVLLAAFIDINACENSVSERNWTLLHHNPSTNSYYVDNLNRNSAKCCVRYFYNPVVGYCARSSFVRLRQKRNNRCGSVILL